MLKCDNAVTERQKGEKAKGDKQRETKKETSFVLDRVWYQSERLIIGI